MITILRKHRDWLMIVIAILAIPFCFYFTKTDFSARRADDLGTVYGHTISHVEFQRSARLFTLARDLGMFPLIQDLTSGATSESSVYTEFTFNRLILRHEADRLGIRASSKEIVDLVRTFRPFAGQNGFDINKYNEFVGSELPSLGFNESQIEEVAGDQIALDKIKQLVASGVQISDAESKENYEEAYGKMDVAVVRVRNDDFAKDINITDDDIHKYYDAHKDQLKSEEKRKVELVAFTLNDEQKKLTGKERVDVLQKLADRANDFSQALSDKNANFTEVAGKFQVPVVATGEFTASAPDPHLKANPQLSQEATKLTPQDPFSDVVNTADGYYVLHLVGKTDARPLSLEEAKPKIVDALRTERLRDQASNKGSQLAQQLRDAVQSGKPLEAAAQQTGVKLERVPPFSLAEPPGAKPSPPPDPKTQAPDLPAIKNAVAELKPGEVTDFVPTKDGGVVAVLEKREPIDPAAYQSGREAFNSRYLRGKRNVAFYEWLRDRRSAAGIQTVTVPG